MLKRYALLVLLVALIAVQPATATPAQAETGPAAWISGILDYVSELLGFDVELGDSRHQESGDEPSVPDLWPVPDPAG